MLKCFCVIKNRAIVVHSSQVKWSWKLGKLHEQQYLMCGHHACNVWTDAQDVRGVGHLQACLDSGLTLEYTGAALKLFGPFSLVPGLIKHLCVSGGPGSDQHVEPLPTSLVGAPEYGPCCCSQHYRAGTEWAGGSSGTAGEGKFPVN